MTDTLTHPTTTNETSPHFAEALGEGPGRGGLVAYAGRYSFHGDRVIHPVELSLFPNWVGSDPVRWGRAGRWPADPECQPAAAGGQAAGARLVWEPVDPDGPGH